MGKSSLFLLLSCLLLQLFLAKSHIPLAPALYVFGDSLVDSGNNNFLPTRAKANYPPYGADFIGGPTGRFTNGKTGADFMAELLRLPFVPPYLGLSEDERTKTKTGVNYASAACGILPETSINERCLSFDKQIENFKKTVETDLPKQFKCSEDLSKYLSKSIFLIVMGSNDYNNYATPETGMMQRYSPHAFAQFLIQEFSKRLTELYRLGARKFVVSDVGPIGCVPQKLNKTNGQCVENQNQMVSIYNAKLPKLLLRLHFTLRGSTFIYRPTFAISMDVKHNPAKYGITDTRTSCCDTPNFQCTPNSKPCKNVNEHVFWDQFHPTEASNSIMMKHSNSYSSPSISSSIQQLVLANFNK